MNCWKCGNPTEHGAAECSACQSDFRFSDNEVEEQLRKIEWMTIDWDKITTLEEMKMVLKEADLCYLVEKNSEEAKRIEKFLKPLKEDEDNE